MVIKIKTTLKQIGMILFVSGFLAFIANTVHPRKIPWVQQWSDQVEAKARGEGIEVIPFSVALSTFRSQKAVFIDARSSEEFVKGHIPEALPIPFSNWEDSFMVLAGHVEAGNPLVVYCSNRECDDALLLAIELKAMGAEKLYLFIDGYDSWSSQVGAPVMEGSLLP